MQKIRQTATQIYPSSLVGSPTITDKLPNTMISDRRMSDQKLNTVLLIDDEKIDRKLYKRVIDRSELVGNLQMFEYADQALDYIRHGQKTRKSIDAIFLDINMPKMSGFEFLDEATQAFGPEFASVVIIMLTTSLDPKDIERAKSMEIVRDYINKPLTVEHVEQVVDLVLAG